MLLSVRVSVYRICYAPDLQHVQFECYIAIVVTMTDDDDDVDDVDDVDDYGFDDNDDDGGDDDGDDVEGKKRYQKEQPITVRRCPSLS